MLFINICFISQRVTNHIVFVMTIPPSRHILTILEPFHFGKIDRKNNFIKTRDLLEFGRRRRSPVVFVITVVRMPIGGGDDSGVSRDETRKN